MSAIEGFAKSFSEVFETADLLAKLEGECLAHSGGQKGWAKDHGVSPAYVNDILHERREVSQRFAALLGFARHVIFIEV